MASVSGRYRKFEPLSMDEIQERPAIIGTPSVCGIGGISIVTAQRLMKGGTFTTARKLGHNWRVAKHEVLEYFGITEA